ncbi:hypothetical protein QJQ45_024748 [Haematococcus lacustris]|nr:hypothetical protein QJQ45_024748 [Haematococcus lacustris]
MVRRHHDRRKLSWSHCANRDTKPAEPSASVEQQIARDCELACFASQCSRVRRCTIVVEEDAAHRSVYGAQPDSLRRALYSAIVTLTLGVLGRSAAAATCIACLPLFRCSALAGFRNAFQLVHKVNLHMPVLRSTILPVPFAFSKLGVIPGCATMAVVAFVNDRTCLMLIRASNLTGRFGFEELAAWAGGRKARVLTQVSLILLLYGTLCGGLAFLSDVARIMVLKGVPCTPSASGAPSGSSSSSEVSYLAHQAVPGLLSAGSYLQQAQLQQRRASSSSSSSGGSSIGGSLSRFHAAGPSRRVKGGGQGCDPGLEEAWWLQRMRVDGRPAMLLVVALVLFPLCLQRHIRQFEKAATVGVVVIVALMLLIASQAVQQGFPAITSGQVPIWFKPGSAAMLPEAFAVLGFAFYMQPMLMPLLAEMPRGEAGMKVSEQAVHITLYGVASAAYGSVGLFGAALFGDATESNIMVNDLLPGQPQATLVLYGALMVYLCCGMVTTHYALRASLEVLLCGEGAPYVRARSVAETVVILLAALAVACTFPSAAEKIFALTGCTAVCLVCYVIPVFVHLRLRKAVSLHRAEQTRRQRAALAVGKAVASRDPDCESGSARGEEALQQQQQDVDENEPLLVVLPATPSAGYSVQAAEPGFAVCATRPKCKRSCSDRETSAHTAIEQPVELALAEELAQLPLSTSWDASECLQHFPVVHSATGQVLGQLLLPAVVIIVGPPQAPRSSQAASPTAASEPGPSSPQPAKRSKRTKAEPGAGELYAMWAVATLVDRYPHRIDSLPHRAIGPISVGVGPPIRSAFEARSAGGKMSDVM